MKSAAGGGAVVVVILIVPVAGIEVGNQPVAAKTADTLARISKTTMIVTIADFFILLNLSFYFCHVRKRLELF